MATIHLTGADTNANYLEVVLPGGRSIYFCSMDDMPIEDAREALDAVRTLEKYADTIAKNENLDFETSYQVFAAFETFIKCGLDDDDREAFRQARIPMSQVYNVLAPAIGEHYKGASENSTAGITAPQVEYTYTPNTYSEEQVAEIVARVTGKERAEQDASYQVATPHFAGGLKPGEAVVSRI